MSYAMVERLIYKDWYFNRWGITTYVAAGLLALIPIAVGGKGAFYLGSIVLITALISVGIHLAMVTVIHERSEHTLPFVMTLPISAIEYTTAKIVANVMIFLAAWVVLVVGTLGVIAGRAAIPDGLIPFALVVLFQLLVGYVLLLAMALVSESQGWAICGIILGNFLLQGVMFWISNVPAIAQDMKSDSIAWRQPIPALLGGELAVIVLLLVLTFYLQSRKTDFL